MLIVLQALTQPETPCGRYSYNSILQIRKLRPKEVKQLAQGLLLQPRGPSSRAHILSHFARLPLAEVPALTHELYTFFTPPPSKCWEWSGITASFTKMKKCNLSQRNEKVKSEALQLKMMGSWNGRLLAWSSGESTGQWGRGGWVDTELQTRWDTAVGGRDRLHNTTGSAEGKRPNCKSL